MILLQEETAKVLTLLKRQKIRTDVGTVEVHEKRLQKKIRTYKIYKKKPKGSYKKKKDLLVLTKSTEYL